MVVWESLAEPSPLCPATVSVAESSQGPRLRKRGIWMAAAASFTSQGGAPPLLLAGGC